MKVSVVIPAYNEELFLPRLLESLKKQSIAPHEIIVVDNNSTDNTAAIAKSFGTKVVFEATKSYAYACNAGFLQASGNVIARVDSDYVVPKNWIKTIIQEFEKDKDIIALGGPTYPLESHWWEDLIYYPGILMWMHLLKALKRGFFQPNMAVKKTAFYKTGGFDTKILYGEDSDMCMRLAKVGKIKLTANTYVYTSIRRMRQAGFLTTVFEYTFANQLAFWIGLPVKNGLEPVRVVPEGKPKMRNPLFYFLAWPTMALVAIFIIGSANSMQLDSTQFKNQTLSFSIKEMSLIKKPMMKLKNVFIDTQLIFQPIKRI